ncbi:GNAT family N-acetyltransferase [bacterium]|nr:GNAT family N-acetyltransferase [bacterium]
MALRIEYLADHPDFIPTLARWMHEEWGYLYPEHTLETRERIVTERANKDRIPLTLVAIDGDEPVGTVGLKINDMDTRPDLTPWLASLYVKETRRREGIGARLVEAIEIEAAKLGVTKLYLYTPKSESFYTELGWSVTERVEYRGDFVSVMVKLIRLIK